MLIIDQILLSPSVPHHLRGMVHAMLVQALVQLGQYHQQKVAFFDEFDA